MRPAPHATVPAPALKDWSRFAAAVIEEMDEAVLLLDAQGIIFSWNRGARRIFGYEPHEVLGQHVRLLVPPERREDLRRIKRELERWGRVSGVASEALAKDGRSVPVSVTETLLSGVDADAPLGYALILYDLRERRAMERQLLRADRLATIGMLASSVAHEVGTPLNVILGRAELLAESLRDSPEALRQIEAISTQIQRISGVVSRLLSFSRDHGPGDTPVSLNGVIEDVLAFVEPRMRAHKVTLSQQLEPELPQLRGDASQLHQVFLNLVMNALDAMPDGGELTLGTSTCSGGGGNGLGCECLQAVVSDTGIGIPADRIERIFDPFYTSKDRSKGTGLGLAIAQEIVRKYSGQIVVDSVPGSGTRFVVNFPRLAGCDD